MDSIRKPWLAIGSFLVRFSVGRIVLHVVAMLSDGCVIFHWKGIERELPSIASAWVLFERARGRLVRALTLYLGKPLKHCIMDPSADPRFLGAALHRGDVLLTDGMTRAAALVKCVTRSRWSHVSVYVGPLDDGPDPLCVVEADVAAGVRSIRLSEINARQLVVLRPMRLSDADRCRLVDWVVARIGSHYDFAHALRFIRNAVGLPLGHRFGTRTRTIARSDACFSCSSLLADAFASIGYPILVDQPTLSRTRGADCNLVPSDFERARLFTVVRPSRLSL